MMIFVNEENKISRKFSRFLYISTLTYVTKCAVSKESKGYYSADKRMGYSVA